MADILRGDRQAHKCRRVVPAMPAGQVWQARWIVR
jgi:hypothetical protein